MPVIVLDKQNAVDSANWGLIRRFLEAKEILVVWHLWLTQKICCSAGDLEGSVLGLMFWNIMYLLFRMLTRLCRRYSVVFIRKNQCYKEGSGWRMLEEITKAVLTTERRKRTNARIRILRPHYHFKIGQWWWMLTRPPYTSSICSMRQGIQCHRDSSQNDAKCWKCMLHLYTAFRQSGEPHTGLCSSRWCAYIYNVKPDSFDGKLKNAERVILLTKRQKQWWPDGPEHFISFGQIHCNRLEVTLRKTTPLENVAGQCQRHHNRHISKGALHTHLSWW